MKEKKRKKKRVIPGFGLSFGITIAMLGFIVVIPLCTLVIFSAKLSFTEFITTVTRPRVLSSYRVSLETALIAALIDAVMGTILAWVLVRYNFPGKQIMNGIIELPFALPTAVAGIALTHLTTTNGWLGAFFGKFGIRIAYTRLGIIFALIFRWNTIRSEGCPAGAGKGGYPVRGGSQHAWSNQQTDSIQGNSSRDTSSTYRRIHNVIRKRTWRIWQCRIHSRKYTV